MTKVTVLLNREEDEQGRLAIFSRFRDEEAYQEGDALESVFEFETEVEAEGVLDYAFALFNRGSGIFIGDEKYPQRSLSVGDLLEIDGERYVCASVGWRKVG